MGTCRSKEPRYTPIPPSVYHVSSPVPARDARVHGDFHSENHLSDRNPLSRVGLPGLLNRPPKTSRKFGMTGASRPTSLPHGDDPGDLRFIREWGLTRECLIMRPLFSGLSGPDGNCALTSHIKTPNA